MEANVKILKEERVAFRLSSPVKKALKELAKIRKKRFSELLHELALRELQQHGISIEQTVKIV